MKVTTTLRAPFYGQCRHTQLRMKFWIIVTRRHDRGIPQRYRERPDGVMEPIIPRGNLFIRQYKVTIRK